MKGTLFLAELHNYIENRSPVKIFIIFLKECHLSPLSGVVNRVAIWFYYRKAFATAFAVLSRAQFWLSRRHFFRNIFRYLGFRGAFARTVVAFAAWNWCTPFAELSRGFRAWRFCFRGRFPTWTRILNPFMEVFDAAPLVFIATYFFHSSTTPVVGGTLRWAWTDHFFNAI